VLLLYVSRKKEKILLLFFSSTISQNKLDQATGIKNVQNLERCFLDKNKKQTSEKETIKFKVRFV